MADATVGRSAAASRLRGVLQAARKNQHEVLVQKVVNAAVKEEASHTREREQVVRREEAFRTRIVALERSMRWATYSRYFSGVEDIHGSSCFGAQVQLGSGEDHVLAALTAMRDQRAVEAETARGKPDKRCLVA
jgi:hypothetical protein